MGQGQIENYTLRGLLNNRLIDKLSVSLNYKRQSKNVQKWEFKNVQFYSLNISFKR